MLMTSVTLCVALSLNPQPSYLLLAPSELQQGVPFTLSVSILASPLVRVLLTCRLQGYKASASRTLITGGQPPGSGVRDQRSGSDPGLGSDSGLGSAV